MLSRKKNTNFRNFIAKLSRQEKVQTFTLLALLVGITLFIYSFLITSPKTVLLGDAPRYNGYQALIIKYSLTHFGQFAFWDNLISAGVSWISHPSGLHFSPLAWISMLFFDHPATVVRFMAIVYITVSALVFYTLLRVLQVSKITSFFVTIPYVANRYTVLLTLNGWMEEFFGLLLLPLSTLFLWLALSRRNYLYAVAAGATMAMHFFENTYYVFHYNLIVLLWISVFFGLHMLWPIRKQKRQLGKSFARFLVINFVFVLSLVGISAVKLIPLLEFRALSARDTVPLAEIEAPNNVMDLPFLFESLRNFITPPFNPTQANTTAITNWANLVACFLVALAFLYALRRRSITLIVFPGLLLMGMWAYLANRVPLDLYAFYYNFLPGFNSNVFPFRFYIIIHFAFFVCLALGMDVLIKQKRFYTVTVVGLLCGILLAFASASYTKARYTSFKLPTYFDLTQELKKPTNISVIPAGDGFGPPAVIGNTSESLLVLQSLIAKAYKPEGRIHSTFLSSEGSVSQSEVLMGELPVISPNYAPVVPTYQYGIYTQRSAGDPLELIRKQYKIYSVLNTRFHLEQREFFEYKGCYTLELFSRENETIGEPFTPNADTCSFLENRLVPIVRQENGGIYFDKDVLPKIALLPKAVLVISDNRFRDFSSFFAKQILFHNNFNERKVSIFTDDRTHIEDYTLEELQGFAAVLLVEPKVKDAGKANSLLEAYKNSGGQVLDIQSVWHPYNNLQKRSQSLYTDKPAWAYNQEDEERLRSLFELLAQDNTSVGTVTIDVFTPEKITVRADTVKENTVLQYSDTYFPGWKVKVNNVQEKVYMADGLVKGVLLEKPGTHLVTFYYSPDSFKKGAFVTVATLAIISIFLFRIHIKKLFTFAFTKFFKK